MSLLLLNIFVVDKLQTTAEHCRRHANYNVSVCYEKTDVLADLCVYCLICYVLGSFQLHHLVSYVVTYYALRVKNTLYNHFLPCKYRG